MQTVHQHHKGRRWTSTKKNIFLKTEKLTNILTSVVDYSTVKHLWRTIPAKNNQRLQAVNYFPTKSLTQMFVCTLNTPQCLI